MSARRREAASAPGRAACDGAVLPGKQSAGPGTPLTRSPGGGFKGTAQGSAAALSLATGASHQRREDSQGPRHAEVKRPVPTGRGPPFPHRVASAPRQATGPLACAPMSGLLARLPGRSVCLSPPRYPDAFCLTLNLEIRYYGYSNFVLQSSFSYKQFHTERQSCKFYSSST